MSTDSSSNPHLSHFAGETFSELARPQNQPPNPASSQQSEDTIISADGIREHDSNLHNQPPTTTKHLERNGRVTQDQSTKSRSQADHENPVASIPKQRGTGLIAPAALHGPDSFSTSLTASTLSSRDISVANTTGPSDVAMSTQDAHAGLLSCGRPTQNVSELVGQETLRLDPPGPNCIRDNATKNELMELIERHVLDPETPNYNLKAMNLADELLIFYDRNAKPPDQDPYIPDDEKLASLITPFLKDNSTEPDSKCRKILKAINSSYGNWGWAAPPGAWKPENDSAIADMSQSSQSSHSRSILSASDDGAIHQEKRARELTVPVAPHAKRARLDSTESQTSLHSQMLSQNLSTDISQSLSNSTGKKISCLEDRCAADLKDIRGVMKHIGEVHFPSTAFICRLNTADERPCREMRTRKDGFIGPTSHFESHHHIPHDDGKRKRELVRQLTTITINDMFHDVCPLCEDYTILKNYEDYMKHTERHYNGALHIYPYKHRCKTDHNWRNSSCIPEEYRENIDAKKKRRRSGHNYEYKNLDDQDKDDEDGGNAPGPPGPGSRFHPGHQTNDGTGNEGQGSSRSSAANTSHNDGGSNQYQSSSEPPVVSFSLARLSGIKAIKRCFKSIRQLGRGGFGTVDEVLCKSTDKTYARKILPLDPTATRVSAEVEILKHLRHQHIISLAAYCTTSDQLWIFMTPVAEKDLAAYLRDDEICGIGWHDRELRWKWADCLASGLKYLHESGIVHGDIKPQNMLISWDQKIYLADFGSARAKYSEQSYEIEAKPTLALTPKYCAPEASYYKSASHSWNWAMGTAADIFSLACVLAEIETVCTGLSIQAFETFRSGGSAYTSFQANIPRIYLWIDLLWVLQEMFPQTWKRRARAPRALQIVKDMLNFDPLQRPNVDQLTTIFHCTCKIDTSIPSHPLLVPNQHISLPSSNASSRHQLDSIFPSKQINMTIQIKSSNHGKVMTDGFCPNDTGFNWVSDTQRWFFWEAGHSGSASPCFFGNQANDCQPVLNLSRTFLLNGHQADLHDILIRGNITQFEFQQRETFLLKLRSWIDIQQMHEKELKELADLRRWRGCSIQTLLGFHRSYPSGSVHGLHSLTDYFQEISPPSSVEDTLKFWGSVLVVIDALDECAIEDRQSYLGWHQDVKLENILVLSSDKSPYEWKFGIGDAGFPKKMSYDEDDVNCYGSAGAQGMKISRAPERYQQPSRILKADIWSLGCIFSEAVRWVVQGNIEIASYQQNCPVRSESTPPYTKSDIGLGENESWLNRKARKSKEDLLESLAKVSDSVTKSIAESVIAPMFETPDEKPSLKRIRDLAGTVLNNLWSDYKKSIAKAASPILSFVRPLDKNAFRSSIRATDGRCSDQTEIFAPDPEKNPNDSGVVDDDCHKGIDIEPNISTGSSCYSYTLERYIQDKSDYRLFLVSNPAPAGSASKELHKIFLRTVMDRFEKADDSHSILQLY